LRKNDELTSIEISEQTGCSINSVKRAVKRLLKDVSEKVEYRILTREEKVEKYGHKIGCRIYIYRLNE